MARLPARPGRKLLEHDRALGVRYVAGVDEVGRGCLAGPLVAAAVVFDMQRIVGPIAAPLGRLDDSKRLSAATRDEMYDAILARAESIHVIAVSARAIDEHGLHVSNLEAMRRALTGLSVAPGIGLVDGFDVQGLAMPTRRIVKGDRTSASIAAASIVAKVTRDRMMRRLDAHYDGRWAFAEHVGYATDLHRERIALHGVTDQHRRSFASIAYTDDMWESVSEGVLDVLDLDVARGIAVDERDIETVVANAAL